MGRKNYFWLLLLVILYFLGLTFQLPKDDTTLFVRELYFAFFLLIVASLGLYSIASKVRAAWLYFVIFFAITIFNTLFLYIEGAAKDNLTAAMIVLGLVGIVYTVKQLGKRQCKRRVEPFPEEVRPIIVENMEPEKEETEKTTKKATKKTAKKATKKTPAKKKTTKKTTKKATKKTPARKKATKKTAKKTTKKTPARKKATKKTTKGSKKTKAKSTRKKR